MMRTSLYFHTIRHLRPRQIASRLFKPFKPRVPRPAALARVEIDPGTSHAVPWLAKRAGRKGQLCFLNLKPKPADSGSVDWRSPEMPKLWRYNLHYFDYLHDAERSLAERGGLIEDWIAHNPAGTVDAWEPFPVSLRIVNWIKFFVQPENRGRMPATWMESLFRQALWLESNQEYHLMGNHLFKNAKALMFAGLFFQGKDARRWRERALKLLTHQIAEQVLPDGGHFERSPMYHAMILEDCLDLVNIADQRTDSAARTMRAVFLPVAGRMATFLKAMTLPDGEIALFNDAALGIEPPPDELFSYCEQLTGAPVGETDGVVRRFPESGYFIMAPRKGDRLIVDCGPVGPDYQPGHAHCDTLSFELALAGRRVIVDSGCFHYEDGPIRRYNRGNAGHNTVTIDGQNQSEVWGAHRCARRAQPCEAAIAARADGALAFQGAHDGYRRLKGAPIHQRRILWAGDKLIVDDRIAGSGVHDLASRLHFHPDLKIAREADRLTIMDGQRPIMTVWADGPGQVSVAQGWYCPRFNIQRACPVLLLERTGVPLPARVGWVMQTAGDGSGLMPSMAAALHEL
jgi:uncharacterized heparinase superfamily protein